MFSLIFSLMLISLEISSLSMAGLSPDINPATHLTFLFLQLVVKQFSAEILILKLLRKELPSRVPK